MRWLNKRKSGGQKIAIVTAVCAFGIAASLATSNAAPKTMPDGGTFDAEYYAQNNPDVVAALGTDENVLYQHYLKYGKAEGRAPYKQAVKLTDEEIYNRAMALKAKYPEGSESHICEAFAGQISCEVFEADGDYPILLCNPIPGQLPAGIYHTRDGATGIVKTLTFDDIKAGDVLDYSSNTTKGHSVFVMAKTNDSVIVCEGNVSGRVRWNHVLYKPGTPIQGNMEVINTIKELDRRQE